MTNNSLYEHWKPLRNILRKVELQDSLRTLREYAIRLEQNSRHQAFPADMSVHEDFYSGKPYIFEWDIEILMREVIICSPERRHRAATLRSYTTLNRVINAIKRLDTKICEIYIEPTNVMHELTRISHRQFPYQTNPPSLGSLIRHYLLMSHPEVEPIFVRKFKMSPKVLFTIGGGFWSSSINSRPVVNPENAELPGVSKDNIYEFLARFSRDIQEIRKLLINPTERAIDETFFYRYHSLKAYPLLRISNNPILYMCPLPTLLFWRFTRGLYYELLEERGFDQAFGESFEDYVKASALSIVKNDASITIYPEEKDTRNIHRCDAILDQSNAFIIIECKTKRMRLEAATNLLDTSTLDAEIAKIAKAVLQSYQSYIAYERQLHPAPKYKFDPQKQGYIVVVTLEDWYFYAQTHEKLLNEVKTLLHREAIDENYIAKVPYTVVSVSDFEKLVYLTKTNNLQDILNPFFTDKKYEKSSLASYLDDKYKEDIASFKGPFPEKINEVFTAKIL